MSRKFGHQSTNSCTIRPVLTGNQPPSVFNSMTRCEPICSAARAKPETPRASSSPEMSDSDGESYGTQPVGSASEVPKKRNSVTSKGRLCNRCSFLYFRAESSRYGFQEDISEGADGRSRRLTFPEFSSSIKFSHYKPPAIIDNYRVRDDLPELPRLRESALAGCDFCGILREALIQDTRRRNRSNKTIDIHKLLVLRAFDAGLPTDTNPDRRFAAIEVSWFSDYKLYGTIYFKLCGNAGQYFLLDLTLRLG